MKTLLKTSDYSRVESIVICGVTFNSTYNHNYYYNESTDDIILEETDDDQTCLYYRVFINDASFKLKYLGLTDDEYGYGIFDENYEGYPYRNNNGEIELDNTMC